ncbi:unnamed protein product [Acanthosepion pharaonis]|uniref:Uncharacterized protein n=1 Tax=Acanthosepion pharaonis TaxID=158019 RepID=A0A812CTK1_ACAPH|nr:unnamed protein product [Sepia pharaonis]
MICHIPLLLTVKCFHQINEHHTVPTLLLQLPENKHHVCYAPVGSEAALTLWKVIFHDDRNTMPIQQNPCKDLSCNGEQSNPLVIGAVRFFPIFFVQGNDDCIVEILFFFSLLLITAKEHMEFHKQHWASMLPEFRVFSFHFQLHLHTLLYFYLLFHFLSLFPYLFLLIFTLPTLFILSLFHTLYFYACYPLVLFFTISSSVLPFFVSLFFLPLLKTLFHPIYHTCLIYLSSCSILSSFFFCKLLLSTLSFSLIPSFWFHLEFIYLPLIFFLSLSLCFLFHSLFSTNFYSFWNIVSSVYFSLFILIFFLFIISSCSILSSFFSVNCFSLLSLSLIPSFLVSFGVYLSSIDFFYLFSLCFYFILFSKLFILSGTLSLLFISLYLSLSFFLFSFFHLKFLFHFLYINIFYLSLYFISLYFLPVSI